MNLREAEPKFNAAVKRSGSEGLESMSNAETYEHYAMTCLDLAERIEDPAVKLKLLEMAQKWRHLAQRAEQEPNSRQSET